jgi:hypothetical protein
MKMPCPKCGLADQSEIYQSSHDRVLRWSRSTRCSVCGAIEEDADGFPPREIRAKLALESGVHEVVAEQGQHLPLLVLMRRTLAWTTPKTDAVRHRLPVVFVGTKVETEWLVEVARGAGQSCSARPQATHHGIQRPLELD